MAVDARAHAGMNGRNVTTSIKDVAALQFPFGCLAGIAYQRIGKDNVWGGGLAEVLIIDVEVDAQFLGREYPYLAVVGVGKQSRQRHVAISHPLFCLHPSEAIGEVEILARSCVERCADSITLCMERLDEILQQKFAFAAIPSCRDF